MRDQHSGTRKIAMRVRHALNAVALALLGVPAVLSAQDPARDVNAERRARAGAFLSSGWHPYGSIGPAIPVGRLGDLANLGLSAQVGAWLIRPEVSWPGFGVEASYADFNINTAEPIDGRYQIVGASLRLTSKGRQRLLFDWLGGYGAIGAGVFRHGFSGATARTAIGASGKLGMLVPLAGREGFIETRVQHLFSGETLGRGNGLTYAPLLFGVRF